VSLAPTWPWLIHGVTGPSLGSRHEHSADNWAAYRQRTDFHLACDERLSRRLLPPAVGHAGLPFARAAGSA
jgi:hypothetical protein